MTYLSDLVKPISELIKPKHTRDSIPMTIPKKYLEEYTINIPLIASKFYMNIKYAETLGLLFRFKSEELGCTNCMSFHGEWIDADEVKETCSTLSEVHVGHRGYISNREPCNFYKVMYALDLKDPAGHPKLVEAFNNEIKNIDVAPDSAYKLLLKELEDKKWITKKSV